MPGQRAAPGAATRGNNTSPDDPPTTTRQASSNPTRVPARLVTDLLELAEQLPLTGGELGPVGAVAAQRVRGAGGGDLGGLGGGGYTRRRREPLPASAAIISGYLTELACADATGGTMSQRMSAIRFAHQMRNQPEPTIGARVLRS